MYAMFARTSAFNQPLNFDTSSVTNMGSMFHSATSFNQALDWNTSNVERMDNMFRYATTFDQALNFDTSSVTNMGSMFYGAIGFNEALDFNTSSVTRMGEMFKGATSFNKALSFDTSSVTSMFHMFNGATSFNQDLSAWDVDISDDARTSEVLHTDFSTNWGGGIEPSWPVAPISRAELKTLITNYSDAYNADQDSVQTLAYAQDIINANTSEITDLSSLFSFNTSFNLDISKWDTSNVTNMRYMFYNSSFNQALDWNTSNVITMESMFQDATTFNQDLSAWDISSVTNHTNFSNNWGGGTEPKWPLSLADLKTLITAYTNDNTASDEKGTYESQIINADTSAITDMSELFKSNTTFNLDISKWNTSSVTNMSNMFAYASLFNQNIATWDFSSVTNMNQMLLGSGVRQQDLSNWNVSSGITHEDFSHSEQQITEPWGEDDGNDNVP